MFIGIGVKLGGRQVVRTAVIVGGVLVEFTVRGYNPIIVEITAPAAYATGPISISLADLAAGPVNIVAPSAAESGGEYTYRPGVWLTQATDPVTIHTARWLDENDVDLGPATTPITPASGLKVSEVAENARGLRSVGSEIVEAAADLELGLTLSRTFADNATLTNNILNDPNYIANAETSQAMVAAFEFTPVSPVVIDQVCIEYGGTGVGFFVGYDASNGLGWIARCGAGTAGATPPADCAYIDLNAVMEANAGSEVTVLVECAADGSAIRVAVNNVWVAGAVASTGTTGWTGLSDGGVGRGSGTVAGAVSPASGPAIQSGVRFYQGQTVSV